MIPLILRHSKLCSSSLSKHEFMHVLEYATDEKNTHGSEPFKSAFFTTGESFEIVPSCVQHFEPIGTI